MAGIPIAVAMKKINETNNSAGGHKFYGRVHAGEQNPAECAANFLRAEKDLAGDAREYVDNLNLPHLKFKKSQSQLDNREQCQAELEVDFYRVVEKDFTQDAEMILERLNLSHMKTKKARL